MVKKKIEKNIDELLTDALIKKEDQPYQIPGNWVWVKLGSIIGINMGQSPKGNLVNDNPIGFPLIGGPKDMGDIYSISTGTTFTQISKTHLFNTYFPLPPLPEQKRIVTKLSSMLEKLKQAKELIQEARETFETRRAAILHKAFTGELTNKWREKNENLVSNIPSSIQITDNPYDIALGWKWVLLKDVAEKPQYGTSAKSSKSGKVPVVRMGNIQNGRIDWNSLVYTSVENEIEKYNLSHNDILFNRTNSPALVGKTAIYKNEMPAIFAGYLIRIKSKKNLNPDYLNYFLNSPYAKIKCQKVKTDGVNQSNINSKKLGKFEIPLTSIKEQKEIVRILDKILNKETESSHRIELENEIDLLEKSILSKAFRGELNTSNPDDGYARNLLRKILQEKEKKPKKEFVRKVSRSPETKGVISVKMPPCKISMSVSVSGILTISKQAQYLMDAIKENFGQEPFIVDELKNKGDLSYEDLKSALLELLKDPLDTNGRSQIQMTWEKNEYTLQLV